MAVYVIAVLACAAMLYVSFRSLAMHPDTGVDGGLVLETLLDRITAGAEEVATGLALSELSSPAEGEDALTAGARSGRRRLAGYEQQMARLDAPPPSPALAQSRDYVAAAVEDLSWACRMVETASYRENGGLQEAVAGLAVHARRCLNEGSRVRAQTVRK